MSTDLEKAAKIAIQMEDEGYAIYVKAAKKTKNPLGRSTLQAIADKEVLHKKAIENFYNKLTGKKYDGALIEENTQWSGKLKSEVLNDIKDEIGKRSPEETDLSKSYDISMDLERKGYDFYKNIANTTDNQQAKDLFNYLAKEENLHFELLQDTHLYLSKPAEWFNKEEKWLVEG